MMYATNAVPQEAVTIFNHRWLSRKHGRVFRSWKQHVALNISVKASATPTRDYS